MKRPINPIRYLLKKALRRPPDEALSTIELIGIVVVTGILATLAVFGIGSLIDDAESNVAESNLNTVVSAIQSIGSDRLSAGGFSYSGEATGDADLMIDELQQRVSNINFAAIPSTSSRTDAATGQLWAAADVTAAGVLTGINADPNTVYVAVNTASYANTGGLAIPIGHIARIVVRSATETTMCAILVRSTDSAGVGYDSWTTKTDVTQATGSGNTHTLTGSGNDSWRALCLPGDGPLAPTTAAEVVNGSPPQADLPTGITWAIGAAGSGSAVTPEVDIDDFHATLPDPGRRAIHE